MASADILRTRLTTGAPAFTAWCGLPEPMVAGLLAREGFDAVTLDMQHGFIDFGVAMRAIPLIVAAGKPAIVRIPVGEFATASRLLDAGATGIIAPMINTSKTHGALPPSPSSRPSASAAGVLPAHLG